MHSQCFLLLTHGCFIVTIAHNEMLCKKTSLMMVSGAVNIEPIWTALGIDKAEALPIFHAFTGADTIGKFSSVSRTKWFQQYMKAEISLPRALLKLLLDGDIPEDVKEELAKFVCLKCCPKDVSIASVPELRWYLFCKQQVTTYTCVLEEHINRVRWQNRVWCQAHLSQQQLFDPLQFGYNKVADSHVLPVTVIVLPHHHRPSLRWSYANARLIAPHMFMQEEQFSLH